MVCLTYIYDMALVKLMGFFAAIARGSNNSGAVDTPNMSSFEAKGHLGGLRPQIIAKAGFVYRDID